MQPYKSNLAHHATIQEQFGSPCNHTRAIWFTMQPYQSNLVHHATIQEQFGSPCNHTRAIWFTVQPYKSNLVHHATIQEQFGSPCNHTGGTRKALFVNINIRLMEAQMSQAYDHTKCLGSLQTFSMRYIILNRFTFRSILELFFLSFLFSTCPMMDIFCVHKLYPLSFLLFST